MAHDIHDTRVAETCRVAILAGNLDTEYPRTVIAGASDRLSEAGYTTIVFAGGMLSSEGAPPLYDLVRPERCDGLLCLSGIVGQKVDRRTLMQFLEGHCPIPAVSIAVPVDSHPSVAIDDASGMRAMIAHLIEQHGRRTIGFVRGPASSAEAERRYRAYQEVLASHGLPCDPALVVEGSFTAGSGQAAAEALIRAGRGRLDSIVCANDVMAAAVERILAEHGISVPSEVAVVGFDDAEEARFAIPPLTTVRQPLHRLGWQAAETLLSHMARALAPSPIVLAPRLVTRESCGCLLDGVHISPHGSSPPPPDLCPEAIETPERAQAVELERELLASGGALLLAIGDVLENAGVRPGRTPEHLVEAFLLDLRSEREREGLGFLSVLRDVLAEVPPFESSPWELHPIPTLLRRWIVPRVRQDTKASVRAHSLLHDAATWIAASARQTEAHRRLVAESRAQSLGQVARAISGTADMRALETALAPAIRTLHVRSSNVVMFEEAARPLTRGTLVLRTDPAGTVSLPEGGVSFDTRCLVPDGFAIEHARPSLVVVCALEDGDRTVGYSSLEVGRDELSLCPELARHIHGAFVRVCREREVARLHARERERASELQRATEELETNRKKLLISEKMAALGRLTAGMANEMATPLGAVREAFGDYQRLSQTYQQLLAGGAGAADMAHQNVVEAMRQCIARATLAAERVAGFVHGIKVQTRDLSRKEFTRFDAVPVVKDTLLLLDHDSRRAGCAVSFGASRPIIELYGSPSRLAQVVTNLLSNAIDASRPKGGGAIRVQLYEEDGGIILDVGDEGIGIRPEDVPRVFDPLFTTKPFGQGTGLGLNMVRNIVVGEFHGTVSVHSELGSGTHLIVRLPGPPSDPNSPGSLCG